MFEVIILAISLLTISRLVCNNINKPSVFWVTQLIDITTLISLWFSYIVW
jgi:hypothetical protein